MAKHFEIYEEGMEGIQDEQNRQVPKKKKKFLVQFSVEEIAIKKACKGRMVSLKMDTATRLERAVLGINVQIIRHNKIQIYSLAIKELSGKHTAANLKEELENVLKEFEIKKSQIYCITTDNGRNMLKAVELFSDENLNQLENNEEKAINSENFVETVVENFCSEEPNIISVKCAAHTLQLVVKDFLSNTDAEIIDRAREVVKTLRTPTYRHSLQILKLKKPRLDVCTRWNSTYDMLQRLLQYKTFCNDIVGTSRLSEQEWITIQDIVKVLRPVYEATMKLQESQLLVGDFYKLWINLKLQVDTLRSSVADALSHYLERRESQILKNEAVNAAIFLDPRLKRLLSSERKIKAKKHLKSIAARMFILNQNDRTINITNMVEKEDANDNNAVTEATDFSSTSNTNLTLLRNSVVHMELDSSTDDEQEDMYLQEMKKMFNEIDNYKEQRIDIDADLMQYWKEKRYVVPFITKLANIVHAVPVTQQSENMLVLLAENQRPWVTEIKF
ncbi:PREDICTED: uncharacterized protein LOC108781587 [Cyphomyrmex costatus]|uniref:uncharacterized protein LOC108781587 n=1 Tax=Cyphomyrmex costatus TaxID=456900 RepID=UPI000852362D|nr:PREDICTED: uncharacterized protein LOC108781587 [Cyphomyrmex costatus]